MIDSIVFELDLTNLDPAIRNNIVRLWKNSEKATVIPKKANIYNHFEFGFAKRHLTFSVQYPSSNCMIHADLDDMQRTIKFNFSIPKALYGCNLFTSDFHYIVNEECNSQYIDQNRLEKNYKILLHTIFDVINQMSDDQIPLDILLESISFFQLDICFNYYFDSKEYAIAYIDGVKKAQKKYSGIRNMRTFETSLMFVMSDYTVKIYHKGTELLNNKKALELLSENYRENEITNIIDIANNVVRYECSIRSQKLKDLFLRTFRENCATFQSLPDVIKNKFSTRKIKLSRHSRSNYYEFTYESELQAMFKYNKPNQKFIPENFFNPIFDFKTFYECVVFAMDRFNELQVKSAPATAELIQKIDAFNDYAEWCGEKKLSKGTIIKIFNLCRDTTLNELVSNRIISKATKYNFLKKCRILEINFNENSSFEEEVENLDTDGSRFMYAIADYQNKLTEMTIKTENRYSL